MRARYFALWSIALLSACSSGEGTPVSGSGGAGVASGGMTQGGNPSSGGSNATGGAPVEGNGGQPLPTTGGSSMGGVVSGGGGGGPSATGGEVGSMEEYPVPYEGADEDGAALWLRYPELPVPMRKAEYQAAFVNVVGAGASETLSVAQSELLAGLSGLLGTSVVAATDVAAGSVLIGTIAQEAIGALGLEADVASLGPEGYWVGRVDRDGGKVTVVTGNSDLGVLYGTYALLRHLQMHGPLEALTLQSSPKVQHRLLNHWDNLDGTVERGYAGPSIWDWASLPGTVSQRYIDYARACASVGINGTVLTNVNATHGINANMWTDRAQYFPKVQALADAFRPYGIRVYLTAPFNAAGNANPNDPTTRMWWKDRLDELYALIPDFGGLLIKASSEGQPGPSDGATHADGANMLAEAIGDRGIVLWRAFVYGENLASDRIRQAYDEFQPLDGQFAENALVQAKNGALDFQPREPIHPLFGGMPETSMALELQITKEYLGQDTHLAYLGPMWEEILQTETHAGGQAGVTVARVVDGSAHGYEQTAIAGVSNVGKDTNWTGSHFNQANWYTFGRMAWDPDASAVGSAEEWVRMTFSNDPAFVEPVVDIMMNSHQTLVDYMTPLGLVHIMGTDHHYGPMPWEDTLGRAEWNPVYYHQADATGIGFDRTTATGSGAIGQYNPALASLYEDRATVPEDFLLFFHHVGWDEPLSSGRSVWEELVHRYSLGVDRMLELRAAFMSVAPTRIDAKRYAEISAFLDIQSHEARWWRDACLSYFADQAERPWPNEYAEPLQSLDAFKQLATVCPANRDKPLCEQAYVDNFEPTITLK